MAEKNRRDGMDRSLIIAVLQMHSNYIHTFQTEKNPKGRAREQNFVKQTHQSWAESRAALQLARRDS